MTTLILKEAEEELEAAFEYYEVQQAGLGREMLAEFRRGVDRILELPNAWQPLDETHRRYRLRRFPFGIVYRVDSGTAQLIIIAFMHLNRRPDYWRRRERR